MVIYQMLERAYSSELWIYLVLIIIATSLYALTDYLKAVILCFKLKGPPAMPLIGNIQMVGYKNLLTDYMGPAYKLYGPIIRVWVLLFPMFIVLDPADLQVVLSSKKHTDKIFFYKFLHNFLGTGLITSNGDKWSEHRKLIQPSFHLSILEKFIGTFADASQNLLAKLKAAPSELDITHFVNNCVIDILNESVLGVPVLKSDEFKSSINMDNSPFRQGKVVMPFRITRPWLLLDWVYSMTETAAAEHNQKKRLNKFTREMIRIRRESIRKGEITERKCLLDCMIEIAENNPNFTEDDIVNEACTMMLAGQDSVGAAVAFCLYLLAQNQDCQKKCLDECDRIFDTDDRAPTMQDLREMRYLEQCIKETLRLYPSVPLIARKITENIPLGKHKLPAGSNVFIIPYSTHRIPSIYPEPEKFDPERFSPEQTETRHPYAYIPFSAGPRNCIGHKFAIIEIKTVISKILRHYQLYPVVGKSNLKPVFRITVRATGGLWVRLQPRN